MSLGSDLGGVWVTNPDADMGAKCRMFFFGGGSTPEMLSDLHLDPIFRRSPQGRSMWHGGFSFCAFFFEAGLTQSPPSVPSRVVGACHPRPDRHDPPEESAYCKAGSGILPNGKAESVCLSRSLPQSTVPVAL